MFYVAVNMITLFPPLYRTPTHNPSRGAALNHEPPLTRAAPADPGRILRINLPRGMLEVVFALFA